MREFIICSAIHFDIEGEFLAQPGNIKNGFVVAGRRHHNCYATLTCLSKVLGIEAKARTLIGSVGREHQGFITNTNRFVSRGEAFQIAKAAGQLLVPNIHNNEESPILISEELY